MLVLLLIAAPWEPVSSKGGFEVEKRMCDHQIAHEVRVRTTTQVSAEALFNLLWKAEDFPRWIPHSKKVQILERKDKEQTVYEQVKIPVVQDRDYAVRSRYEQDKANGLYLIEWSASDKAPPEEKGHTRIHHTHGSWTLEPAPGGGTIVTYVVASEAGGGVPAWLVSGAQRDAAVDFVKRVLDQARK